MEKYNLFFQFCYIFCFSSIVKPVLITEVFDFTPHMSLFVVKIVQSSYSYSQIGPSGVRALPLAAGINVGGHYKWHFFLSLFLSSSGSLLILPEGVVVGFCNFVWAPK
jgi:hypothetical protein